MNQSEAFMKKSVFILVIALAAVMLLSSCSRKNNKVQNPLANVGSVQPDKVLFDRALDALQHRKYDVARLTFQTLINTYPDSEYIARAKLGVADSWFNEGTNTALAQAEAEYKDFQTFFPNMPEAAEAQLKVAGIHYKQMEKPDRDYTHAKRAEDEYRTLIQTYPDSKLVPEAKQRLREVQEILGDREFKIGRFYYLRQSYPAAIARLKTLADQYPLYSNAEEALWLLGQSYEEQVQFLRSNKQLEATAQLRSQREKLIGELHKKAAEAFSRIVTRYPVTGRAEDAKKRLSDLSFPVPTPSAEAIAQNKEEEAGRREQGRMAQIMGNFKMHPSVSMAAKAGEPSMEDPQPTNATQVMKDLNSALEPPKNAATVETVGKGEERPNDPAPRSDSGQATPTDPKADSNSPTQDPNAAQQPATPPTQVNEAAASSDTKTNDSSATSSSSTQSKDDKKKDESSSKKKKKKKLGIF
jgi:outer membrane protein assembly factor BamD